MEIIDYKHGGNSGALFIHGNGTCVKKMEVDGEMVEVCTAAIGLMPQFPNWVHPMVDFCEDGHIVRSAQIDGGLMDGVPVVYGKPGFTKSDKTI